MTTECSTPTATNEAGLYGLDSSPDDVRSDAASKEHRRVVHLVPALFGTGGVIGGAERYALELSRAMAKRTPTTLISFGALGMKEQRGPLEVRVLRNWIHFRRFQFDPFSPIVLQHLRMANVIHVHQTHTLIASLALMYGVLTKTPVFTSDHGGAGLGLHRCFDVTNWYSGHLHVSDFSRRVFGHAKLATAHTIWGGVDTDKFAPDPQIQRTGQVLYVGRLLPHKGINYLIEAATPDTPLVIAGQRWRHAENFYQLLRQLAVGRNVRFLENNTDSDLVREYQRSLCCVLPSVHDTVFGEHYVIPELLGQTLLEAMACGTPVIGTRITSLPEVIEDGVSGFLVPPNDPVAIRERIDWLQNHPVEAHRMGLAARQRVLSHFTWDRVVDRCFRAYADRLGGSNPC